MGVMRIRARGWTAGSGVRQGVQLRLDVLLLVGALGCCLLVRLAYLLSANGRLDADEAVTGLMARRILHGQLFTFFAGQSYMGSLEQYLQAGVFAVLPQTSFDLRLPELVLQLVVCTLVYVFARRCLGARARAGLAALLFAVGPAFSIYLGVRSRGAYSSCEVISLVGVLLAVSLRAGGRRQLPIAFGFGVCAGLAVWENFQSGYVLVPAAIWAAGSARGMWKRLLPAASSGLVVGTLPVLLWISRHDRLPGPGYLHRSSLFARAAHMFDPVVGSFLGVTYPNGRAFTPLLPAWAAALAAVGVVAVALRRRRETLLPLLRLKPVGREPIDIVLLAFALAPFFYIPSRFSTYAGEPRYLFGLYPLLPIGIAALLPERQRLTASAAAVTALLATSSYLALSRTPPPSPSSGDLQLATTTFRQADVRNIYADYWLAYPLQFTAGSRLSVAPLTTRRFSRAESAVDTAKAPGYLTRAGTETQRFKNTLKALHVRYHEQPAGHLRLFLKLIPPLHRLQTS